MNKIILSLGLSLFSFLMVDAQTVGIKVTSNGDVGVGTATPVEKLDVDGGIKIGNTTNANAGTIRWNGNCFEGYDGNTWLALSAGCGGSGPTCFDGIQNQGETGVDCGGPCAPCGGGGGGCTTIADIDATRPLSNLWWANEYNVGGTAISGDGELYFTIEAISGLSQQVIGLNDDPNTNAHYTGINYGIYFYPNTSLNRYWYIVRENGVNVSSWVFPSSSIVGSVFSIERSGTTITYKQDGNVFYTSSNASSGDLYFDNSFYYPNSGSDVFKIKDISLCPPGATPAAPSNPVAAISNPNLGTEPSAIELYSIELSNSQETILSAPTPNPFSERANVSFSIEHDFYEAELVFSDSYGRELGRQTIYRDRGVIEIESSNLKSGLYQYSLVVDGEVIKTEKMVVVK